MFLFLFLTCNIVGVGGAPSHWMDCLIKSTYNLAWCVHGHSLLVDALDSFLCFPVVEPQIELELMWHVPLAQVLTLSSTDFSFQLVFWNLFQF